MTQATYLFRSGKNFPPLRAISASIGAVFGLGFPPFRGGPFRYLDSLGAGRVLERLSAYQERFGPRFTPAPMLTDLARSGGKFFPDRKR